MRALLAFALALLLAGCHTCEPPTVVEPEDGDVTIFVHGIKGSFLVTEQGERAWLNASDLLSSGDRSLALPPGGDDRFGPLKPAGVLTRFTVFPIFGAGDVYLPWLEFGKASLPGFVPFAYDWRVDAREAVLGLAKRIDELGARRKTPLRVNLVGHSLGGLIAMTYVRYGAGDPAKGITWAGAKNVQRLVLAGAPFGGAASFLRDVLQGDKTGRNARLLAPEAMASFVTAYELLPYPGTFFVGPDGATVPLDLLDAKTWARLPKDRQPPPGGLAACRAFRDALRDDEKAPGPPDTLKVLVVAGTGRPTTQRVKLAKPEDVASADFDASPTVPGDNRVPEASCLPPRPSSYEVILTEADHGALLNAEKVQEKIRALLAK